ncbi:MAG: sulfatase, partial [Planctomycetes bacterium]|nr:sulfatase [Planctomycetota bacterium]
EFPRLQRLDGGPLPRVRVTLDRDEREGLLALPGRRYEWTLPPCAQPQRLDLSLGVAPRDPRLAGAVRLSVLLERPSPSHPVELLSRRLVAPAGPDDAAWEDIVMTLPPLERDSRSGAGGRLLFICEAEGDDPPLAVFGHPILSRAAPERRPNVVLISLDTLRPDRLGCYGGDPALSPRLDALAAQGLRFAQAYSTSSYTLPSHASLLTGQWPAVHGAEDVADRLDAAHSPFLARLLADAGWLTAAFTGGGYVSPEYGFAEGFDRYGINDPVWALETERGRQLLTTMSWERAPMEPALLARYGAPAVERWIEARAGGPPFLLFLHTYVVHNYAPDLASLQAHGLLGADGSQRPFNHQERTAFNEGRLAGDEARARVVQQYLPYYDATVGMADAFTGRVLDALERAGLLGDTLVLVTSDHGEEFGEHDFFGHGETLFEPAVRIPLLARLPAGAAGPPPGSVAHEPVSLADVAPWVLRLCGMDPDPRMLVGPPLGPDTPAPPGRAQLFIELDTHRAHLSVVRQGPLKLHRLFEGRTYGLQPGESRLHDLASDPEEQRDLSAASLADAQRLRERLDQYLELTGALQPRGADEPLDLDSISPEMLQTLKALGYAEFLQGR